MKQSEQIAYPSEFAIVPRPAHAAFNAIQDIRCMQAARRVVCRRAVLFLALC